MFWDWAPINMGAVVSKLVSVKGVGQLLSL